MGAGFSIARGVTTRVHARPVTGRSSHNITTQGFEAGDTRVSRTVAERFLAMQDESYHLDIIHDIKIPVGYGLGCSGAASLSLALALNEALNAGYTREDVGAIAHSAEVQCQTGLGDVLAAYHGGFEIRTSPGAPGVGRIRHVATEGLEAVIACFEPISTPDFLRDSMKEINGMGTRMVRILQEVHSVERFCKMSLEFAGYVNMITPQMRRLIRQMHECGMWCGVALFGQTVFALVPRRQIGPAAELASSAGAITIQSKIDGAGARCIRTAVPA